MTLQLALVFSVLMFSLGAAGIVARRNIAVTLMSAWLMFLGAALSAMSFGRWHLLPEGMAYAVFMIMTGIAVAATGTVFYSSKKSDSHRDVESGAENKSIGLNSAEE